MKMYLYLANVMIIRYMKYRIEIEIRVRKKSKNTILQPYSLQRIRVHFNTIKFDLSLWKVVK